MNRILTTVLITVVFLFLTAFPVAAQQKQVKITELSKNQTIDKDYFATGDMVRIDGNVNGDTYSAGGNVDVSGVINGDLLVAGGNILITGVVRNDIRVAGGNITLSGAKVGGNVTALGGQIIVDKETTIGGSFTGAGGSLTLYGPVVKGLSIAGGQVVIGTNVGGDILAGVGKLTILSGSRVNGSISYWSDSKITIQDDATVTGKVDQHVPERRSQDTRKAAATITGVILFLRITDTLLLLIMGIIFLGLLPIYFESSYQYIKTNFWMSVLVGLIGVIVTPVLIFLLAMSVIGIPVALFLMVLYMFVIWFVRIFPLILLGRLLLSRTKSKAGNVWAFALGLLIYSVLCLIPVVASITFVITVLSGYGTFIMQKRNYYTALREKKLI